MICLMTVLFETCRFSGIMHVQCTLYTAATCYTTWDRRALSYGHQFLDEAELLCLSCRIPPCGIYARLSFRIVQCPSLPSGWASRCHPSPSLVKGYLRKASALATAACLTTRFYRFLALTHVQSCTLAAPATCRLGAFMTRSSVSQIHDTP